MPQLVRGCCRRQPGFTLVEMLVIFGLLGIATTFALLFLTSFLKGANQANINAEVKQNGQIAIEALDRQVRNATDVNWIENDYIRLERASPLKPLHIRCFNDADDANKGINGWIAVVESNSDSLLPSVFEEKTITNREPISGIDVIGCSLDVKNASVGDEAKPKIVTIGFTANQGINAPSRAEFRASAHFETTVSLRKY